MKRIAQVTTPACQADALHRTMKQATVACRSGANARNRHEIGTVSVVSAVRQKIPLCKVGHPKPGFRTLKIE
jgi:hypothetical protein